MKLRSNHCFSLNLSVINIAFSSFLPPYVFILLRVTNTLAAQSISQTEADLPPDSAYLERLAVMMIDRFQITPQQVAQVRSIEVQYSDQLVKLNQAIEMSDRELNKQIISSATPQEIREEQAGIAALKLQ